MYALFEVGIEVVRLTYLLKVPCRCRNWDMDPNTLSVLEETLESYITLKVRRIYISSSTFKNLTR
jgi:hypothetical protein